MTETNISTILSLMAANAAVIIPLFLWNRSESRADHRMALSILDAIQKDIKDFHGRLERQDAELKAHLMYGHSEKRNGK